MGITVTHAYVSAIANSGDASTVEPSDWNAPHVITGLTITGLGTPTLAFPASSFTYTFQGSSDTIVGRATTDTLTNKTLTSPVISGGTIDNNTIGGTTAAAATFTTVTAPTHYGGTAAGSALALTSTSNGSPSGDAITFTVNGAEQQRMISSHELVGATTAQTMGNAGGINPFYQLYGASTMASLSVIRQTTPGGGGAIVALGSSRSTPSTGSYSALQSGDGIGQLQLVGDTGASLNAVGAFIAGQADGNWSTSSSPGRIVFETTASGSVGPGTERMRIDSSGNTTFGNSQGGALATNATNGWPYMPSSAGAPTGTPGTSYPGFVPFQYDPTNHKFWIYDTTAAAWKGVVVS